MLLRLIASYLSLISSVAAHSFLMEPNDARREPSGQINVLSGQACGKPKAEGKPSKATYKRGQKIDFKWPRNNHVGLSYFSSRV